MYGYRRGLGSIGYGDYMNACTGGVDTAQCGFDDTSCLAGAQNVVNACDQQYVTDPSSPHNNPNANTLPTQITSNSPIEQAELFAAGGAVNTEGNIVPVAAPQNCFQQTMTGNWVCEDASGNVIPAAATPASSSAPPASTPATVVSSSAPPANQTPSYQSSAPPATTTPATSTGFDFSSIPWWAWAAAAGVALFAFKK